MKVNLAWLAELVDPTVDERELLRRINTQLGEIESVEDLGAKYDGALIVKVVEAKPHPDADKLSCCLIDDGKGSSSAKRRPAGLVEVVCGAPNVRAGMLAVWLPPGAVVPADDKGGAISAKEIRGVLSQGMLASAGELDFGADSDSIAEVDPSRTVLPAGSDPVGAAFAAAFNLATTVIDIENKMFTHRPDCFGLLGVAREIAAITKSELKRPAWYRLDETEPVDEGKVIKVESQCPQLVPRLRAVVIDGLSGVGESDLLTAARLSSVGIKPVNNIVDITNYAMYLSGQPTHAFDLDKLRGLSADRDQPFSLIARESRPGEQLRLLNGKTLTFDQPAIVIATADRPVALGGIMGGAETEVDSGTKAILLECANFDMYNLRRTTMHYGVFSEAATRFTKGQSPAQIPSVAAWASELIAEAAGGKAGETCEALAEGGRFKPSSVSTTPDFVNDLLGSQLTAMEIAALLEAVEFETALNGENLEAVPPFWRTDIGIPEDIVEEIGRLNGGYASLTPVLPSRPIRPPAADELLELRSKIRHRLASAGASEVMGYSFVADDFVSAAGQNPDNSFRLANRLNPGLQVYRQSLTPSVLALAAGNRRLGYKDFALFEVGCAHRKNPPVVDGEGLPLDLQRTAFVCHRSGSGSGLAFYTARRCLDLLAAGLGLTLDYRLLPAGGTRLPVQQPYVDGRSAEIYAGNQLLGVAGLLEPAGRYAGWEIDTAVLLQTITAAAGKTAYQALAKYPKSSQDLTLKVPLPTAFADLNKVLATSLATAGQQGFAADLRPLGIFQPETAAASKNVSFRLTVWRGDRTLQRGEVSAIVDALAKAAAKDCGASRVV